MSVLAGLDRVNRGDGNGIRTEGTGLKWDSCCGSGMSMRTGFYAYRVRQGEPGKRVGGVSSAETEFVWWFGYVVTCRVRQGEPGSV